MGVFDNIVNNARNFACEQYRQQPNGLIPNPIEDVLRMFWDNLCDLPPPAPPLPPPPAPPFTGGQCQGVVYNVKIRKIRISSGENDGEPSFLVTGKIVGIGSNYNASTGITTTYLEAGGGMGQPEIKVLDTSTVGIRHRYEYIHIIRVDGNADNCGDPPKVYPPAPPAPPGGYTSPPINIPLGNDGDDITVNFNFSPPRVDIKPVINMPELVVNMQLPDVNIPIAFNFNGDVNIGKPATPPTPLPPDIVNTINNTNNTVNNTNNTVNNVFSPTPFKDNPNVNKKPVEVEDGKEEEEEGLLGLGVVLLELPQKSQFGSPTVYFAGWIAFKRDDGYMPREQINFEESFFLAPPGAMGYTITLTNGAKGVVTVYSKKDSD